MSSIRIKETLGAIHPGNDSFSKFIFHLRKVEINLLKSFTFGLLNTVFNPFEVYVSHKCYLIGSYFKTLHLIVST